MNSSASVSRLPAVLGRALTSVAGRENQGVRTMASDQPNRLDTWRDRCTRDSDQNLFAKRDSSSEDDL